MFIEFNAAKLNYFATIRKLTAIHYVVQTLKLFLYGSKVYIFTDYKLLLFLFNMSLVDKQVACILEQFKTPDY